MARGTLELELGAGAVHGFGQTDYLQKPNRHPAHVDLIPRESMPGRCRIGVMVIVPAFAETQQGHQPVVP